MKKALIDISGRNNSGPVIGLELAKALAQNGFEVYAVVAEDALNLQDWLNTMLIKYVYILKTYTSAKNLLQYSIKFQLVEKRRLKKFFKHLEFEYVFKPIFHIWSEGIAAQVETEKLVTICHDPIMHSGENHVKQKLYERHIKNSDEIVVLTKSFVPVVCKNYGFDEDHVHYMPHGMMHLYKEKQNTSISCPYSKENINYLFFGRIEKYKGIGILLEAFNELRREYSNVTLTIAGRGKLDEFQKIIDITPDVNIVNEYIPDEEVGAFFDGPNVVVVLPYLDATQSGVIPIAMEYGVPIIASETGGLKEQMLDGAFGIYTPAGNAEALKERMELFVDNENIFKEQEAVMSKAINELEWKNVVAELLKII